MAKTRSIAVPALMAAICASATPAMASSSIHRQEGERATIHYAGFGYAASLQRQIAGLEQRIDRAQDRHRISRREAAGLRQEVRELERLYARSTRGGLTRYEVRTLEARIARLDRQLRFESRDRNARRG